MVGRRGVEPLPPWVKSWDMEKSFSCRCSGNNQVAKPIFNLSRQGVESGQPGCLLARLYLGCLRNNAVYLCVDKHICLALLFISSLLGITRSFFPILVETREGRTGPSTRVGSASNPKLAACFLVTPQTTPTQQLRVNPDSLASCTDKPYTLRYHQGMAPVHGHHEPKTGERGQECRSQMKP